MWRTILKTFRIWGQILLKKEIEVNVGPGIRKSSLHPNLVQRTNQAKEDQGKQALTQQIHFLLPFWSPKLSMILDSMILGVSKMSNVQVLVYWTPSDV